MVDTARRYPLGAALTLGELDRDPHGALATLRRLEPVSWVPVLDGWLVTRRDLCIEVMRDASRFTVDDPRFSTAQVVGPSMLSLDGPEHRRHRDPFATGLRRSDVMERFAGRVAATARNLVAGLAPGGAAEIRRDLAGPLAVRVVTDALELAGVEPPELLGWYDRIVAAVDSVSAGGGIDSPAREAVAALGAEVHAAMDRGNGLLAAATATLSPPEVVSNAAVMLFGGIETSEGMTTSAFWHLLSTPAALAAVRADGTLVPAVVEESLRLEPAAARVDRYATTDTTLGSALIPRGDLVIVSLTAANRDPDTYTDPDRFDLARPNVRSHVAFAQGPHACIGLHLARLETQAALEAALDLWPGMRVDEAASTAPSGVVFRKPRTLRVTWA